MVTDRVRPAHLQNDIAIGLPSTSSDPQSNFQGSCQNGDPEENNNNDRSFPVGLPASPKKDGNLLALKNGRLM